MTTRAFMVLIYELKGAFFLEAFLNVQARKRRGSENRIRNLRWLRHDSWRSFSNETA